jgi:streptomycin 6-kinase
MNLPPEFILTIQNTFGDAGHAFLDALPESVEEASVRWGLTDVQPVSNLSYNFVAYAKFSLTAKNAKGAKKELKLRDLRELGGSNDVVLKMGVPNREARSELAALRLFNGEGACRLLEYDEEKCWMLLERLKPGVMLATMDDDEEETRIAAEVMKSIWRPLKHVTLSESEGSQPPSQRLFAPLRVTHDKFIQLTDWFFGGFGRLRKMFNGGTGPLDAKLVDRAERSVKDFFAENHRPVLMHGDFHHYNVLSSERGWLVIDPKGVIGPAGYEVGPFMLNPWGSLSDGISHQLIEKRIDILHEHLGFERERILEWSLAHAVLSAWWGIEEKTGWEYAMQIAGMVSNI